MRGFTTSLYIFTTCLAVSFEIAYGIEGRIVGGHDIDISEVPHQVSIQTTWGTHYCGGSLINEDTVLTAAHCVNDYMEPDEINVHLGSTDRTEGGIAIPASSFKYHSEYNEEPVKNDLALIRLSRPVTFSDKVRPIRLADEEPPVGTTVLVTGWGKLRETDSDADFPKTLQGVELKIISIEDCRLAYGDDDIQDSNLCTYREGKDTCQGDSGGPLITNNTLVGVVSWGIGCAESSNPGVFASVADYRDWISTTMLEL